MCIRDRYNTLNLEFKLAWLYKEDDVTTAKGLETSKKTNQRMTMVKMSGQCVMI